MQLVKAEARGCQLIEDNLFISQPSAQQLQTEWIFHRDKSSYSWAFFRPIKLW